MASSNSRLKLRLVDELFRHNSEMAKKGLVGFLLFLDGACVGHILNNITGRAFSASQVITNMHSVSFVANTTAYYNHLIRTLVLLVAEELEYVKAETAPVEDALHTVDSHASTSDPWSLYGA